MKIASLMLLASLARLAYAANPAEIDVCKLLSMSQIEQLQSARVTSTRGSAHDNGDLTSSICFFTTNPFSHSVSLQVISHSPSDRLGIREYWKEKFDSRSQRAEKRETAEERQVSELEQKDGSKPPRAVGNLGDEAYWVDTGRDRALYTLKRDYIMRCSVGGKTDQDKKLANCTKLVQSALIKLPTH